MAIDPASFGIGLRLFMWVADKWPWLAKKLVPKPTIKVSYDHDDAGCRRTTPVANSNTYYHYFRLRVSAGERANVTGLCATVRRIYRWKDGDWRDTQFRDPQRLSWSSLGDERFKPIDIPKGKDHYLDVFRQKKTRAEAKLLVQNQAQKEFPHGIPQGRYLLKLHFSGDLIDHDIDVEADVASYSGTKLEVQ